MQRRRVMLSAGKRSRLPPEFQEVAWLGTSYSTPHASTPFIDTGLTPTQNTRIEFDAQFPHQDTGSRDIYGSIGLQEALSQKVFLFYQTRYSASQKTIVGNTMTAGDEYAVTVKCSDEWRHIVMSNAIRSIDEIVKDTVSDYTFGSHLTFWLGKGNTGWPADWYGGLRTKTVYWYEQGMLYRCYVPCYRKSDNKPGTYELVSTSFLPKSGGNVEFEIGPDVN